MPALHRRLAAAVAIASLAATAGPALAGQPAPARSSQVPDITDAEFLGKAAQSNRFEIASGELAARRGRTRVVRRLGRMFDRDHTKALAGGTAVATRLNIPVPAGLDANQRATVERLRDLRGRRFDRAWLRAQRIAHTAAVALHLRGALTGDTADVRTLSITGLPVVAQHLGELNVLTDTRH